MNSRIQLPIPVEKHIKDIVTDSHLVRVPKQYLSLLDVLKINEETELPAVAARMARARRHPDNMNGYIDMLITIWDIFPGIELWEGPEVADEVAVWTSHAYMGDLEEIIQHLVDEDGQFADYEYEVVGEMVFTPRYGRDLFFRRDEYLEHPFKDRLMGPSVIFTLKGPWDCLRCDPAFTPIVAQQCIADL